MSESYTDPCYGVKMTHVFPLPQLGGSATGEAQAATPAEAMLNMFRLPFKAKLCKYGIIVRGASALGCSTDTCFNLRLLSHAAHATVLGSWGSGAAGAALATQTATAQAPDTATNIPKGRVVVPAISVAAKVGQLSTIMHFMEYQRVYDGGN